MKKNNRQRTAVLEMTYSLNDLVLSLWLYSPRSAKY